MLKPSEMKMVPVPRRAGWLAVAVVGLTLVAAVSCASVAAAAEPAAPKATEPASLAELPFWPLGLQLSDELGGTMSKAGPAKADVMVWTPPGAKRIRAMLIIPNNSDSKDFGQHPPLREALARHEAGIVYLRSFQTGIEHVAEAPADPDRIFKVLDIVAEAAGIAEFRYAPWITFGKSSRGEFPFRMAWLFPKRTIASVSFHGETPTWPPLPWARLKDETILEVNANGETEWGGTWFNHVRPNLLNYRARTAWLPHQVVSWGVGHGDYPDETSGRNDPTPRMRRAQVWDYLAMFIDKAIDLRVPKDTYPTAGPVELKQVDPSTGYLIDPFAVETLFGVPHLPLEEGPDGCYATNPGGETTVSGYAAFAPLKDYTVPEGVPVVKPDTSVQGFKDWILIGPLKFTMQADPMLDLGDLAHLRPKPGDQITIDGKAFAFRPITPNEAAPEGGIRVPTSKMTLVAFTVLDIAEHQCYKLAAPFTAATRQQVVLNGVPVRNKQVLDLQPGRYPLLVVVRMAVKWGRIGPWLEDATDAEVAQAKAMQAAADERAAEEARLRAETPKAPPVVIRKATDVPEAERKKMFWIADKELADAWLKLHRQARKAGQK